jgi:hypothetical protein
MYRLQPGLLGLIPRSFFSVISVSHLNNTVKELSEKPTTTNHILDPVPSMNTMVKYGIHRPRSHTSSSIRGSTILRERSGTTSGAATGNWRLAQLAASFAAFLLRRLARFAASSVARIFRSCSSITNRWHSKHMPINESIERIMMPMARLFCILSKRRELWVSGMHNIKN